MTRALEERGFRLSYREAVEAVARDDRRSFRLPAAADELSMRGYLTACETLYVEALRMLRGREETARPERVLDAGGSFGAFAGALRSLGVVAVEDPAAGDPVDLVVGLALHGLSDSAETIVGRGKRLLKPGGRFVLVVPCRHYWPQRLADLRGRRPPMPDEGVLEVGVPSYGRTQIQALLRRSGLRPDLVRTCDYSPAALGGPMLQIVAGVVTRVAPWHREAWIVLASRAEGV